MNDNKKDNYKKRQTDAKKKQTGELPVDVDQDGKMINPHNPDFITKVPWYLGDSGPTLKHHNVQKVDHFLTLSESDDLIKKKLIQQKENKNNKTISFRKGSCKNCGALTHKEKDCVERPRSSKKSAWKTGVSLAADEVVLELEKHGKVSYDAKRDQWQGYDPSEYKKTVERFQRIDAERIKYKQEQKELQKIKEEEEKKLKLEKKLLKQENKLKKLQDNEANGNNIDEGDEEKDGNEQFSEESDSGSDYDSDEGDNDDSDDAKEFLERDENARDFQARQARQGGVGGAQMKTTVRNLRIREDTPKYLRNLDLNSAFYDPKSRSMRLNPLPNENPEDLAYAGDNFVRYTGDAVALAQTQILCWEMQARGEDIDIISNPSQLELVKKQYVEKKKLLEETKKKELFDKYGVNPESLQKNLDPRLKLGQTESFNEYSHDGRLITSNGVKPIVRTKYEEDVFIGNHLSVWGSYYSRKKSCWGYACCHSTHKNSYCTGEKGKLYNDSDNTTLLASSNPFEKKESTTTTTDQANSTSSTTNSTNTNTNKSSTLSSNHFKRSDLYGEVSNPVDSNQFDEKKVQEAIDKLTKNKQNSEESINSAKKRGYNSMTSVDTTPEEMEAYRRIKVQREDPMAKFLSADNDELLEYEK